MLPSVGIQPRARVEAPDRPGRVPDDDLEVAVAVDVAERGRRGDRRAEVPLPQDQGGALASPPCRWRRIPGEEEEEEEELFRARDGPGLVGDDQLQPAAPVDVGKGRRALQGRQLQRPPVPGFARRPLQNVDKAQRRRDDDLEAAVAVDVRDRGARQRPRLEARGRGARVQVGRPDDFAPLLFPRPPPPRSEIATAPAITYLSMSTPLPSSLSTRGRGHSASSKK